MHCIHRIHAESKSGRCLMKECHLDKEGRVLDIDNHKIYVGTRWFCRHRYTNDMLGRGVWWHRMRLVAIIARS